MTSPQRLQALERANTIREHRAQLRRDLAAGDVHIADVVERPEPWLRTMPIEKLLLQGRWLGRWKVGKLLSNAEVSGLRPVGELTSRQRRRLVVMLRERKWR